jgi:hypothetical protein
MPPNKPAVQPAVPHLTVLQPTVPRPPGPQPTLPPPPVLQSQALQPPALQPTVPQPLAPQSPALQPTVPQPLALQSPVLQPTVGRTPWSAADALVGPPPTATTRRTFLTACALATRLAAQDTAPIIRCTREKNWTNEGAWGGAMRPTGDKLIYENALLANLDSFAAAISFYPSTLTGIATLLARPNQWQIRLDATGKLTVATYYSPTHSQNSDLTQISELNTWYQIALSFDRSQSRLHLVFRQVGAPDSLASGSYKMVKQSLGSTVPKTTTLEAGKFSGLLDNIAVFDRALSPAELQQVLESAAPSAAHTGLPHISKFILPMERDPAALLPSRADVEMSSRWWHPEMPRPSKPADPHDTMRDLAAFGATRLEWIYDTDTSHIRRVAEAGMTFCATINASDNNPGRPYSGCDFDGHMAVFSWMVSWIQKDGQPTGAACVNNERLRASHAEIIRTVVAAGAGGVQYDDWASNLSFASGECFCEFCRKRFPDYLRANAVHVDTAGQFDYHDYLKSAKGVADVQAYLKYRKQNADDPLQRAYVRFQAASVRDNLTALKAVLKSNARADGKRPTLSVNANFNSTSQQSKAFNAGDIPDYFIGEGGDETLAGMFLNAKIAESLDRISVFSPFPYHVDKTRAEIALQYALGQLCLAPYDVWMHTSDLPRHFGNPADYRDLFGFVREHRDLLEKSETVATVVLAVDSSKPEDARLRPGLETLVENNVPFALALTGKSTGIRRLADLAEIGHPLLRETAVLSVEPRNVVATIRATPDGKTIAIHLVNRNFDEFSRLAELESFGVRLMQPGFWGDFAHVELLAPGEKAQPLACRRFGRDRRIAVPRLRTWAILRIRA